MFPISIHSKVVSLLLHKAVTGYKIRFKSQEFSTFLTTEDENLKHSLYLFPEIEVFYHSVLIYEIKTFFFGIHKKRRFLNIFYVFLFKSLITEKCKLISMNINGYKLLKNVLHFNKRRLLCFKNILRPLSVHVIWILW